LDIVEAADAVQGARSTGLAVGRTVFLTLFVGATGSVLSVGIGISVAGM
jgi:hypothetical protein